MDIKERIKKELYSKDGRLSGAAIRWPSFLEGTLLKEMRELTPFIDINSKKEYAHRVYCILNDIKEIPKCIGCNIKPLTFLGNSRGYDGTCSINCARKIKKWKSSSETKLELTKDRKKYLLDSFYNGDYLTIDEEELKKTIDQIMIDTEWGKIKNFFYLSDYLEKKDLLCSILKRTEYIKIDKEVEWSERLYHIIYNLKEIPKNIYNTSENANYNNIKTGYKNNYNNKSEDCELVASYSWNGYAEKINLELSKKQLKISDDDVNKRLNHERVTLECLKCGSSRQVFLKNARWKEVNCLQCNQTTGYSDEEKEVVEYIKTLGVTNILENHRDLGLEVDIYLPEFRLAIEYNGILWHSFGTTFPNNLINESKNKHKHLKKTLELQKHGIELLHIFDFEWRKNSAVWKSIILNKLNKSKRIFARKCEIKIVDSDACKIFLDGNHSQGSCNSDINIGLYHNNELVSLMTFGKPRFNKTYDVELLRYCNKIGISVIGGAGKLFSYYIKNNPSKSIVSYCDLRKSIGNLYYKLGFKLEHTSKPNYYYTRDNKVYRRYSAQKGKLENLLEQFNPLLTESENMFANGYRRIWDCGNLVFSYKNPSKESQLTTT